MTDKKRERPETIAARSRRWRLANLERNREIKRRWAKAQGVLGPRPLRTPEELRTAATRQKERRRRDTVVGRFGWMRVRAKQRALEKGIPFALKPGDLVWTDICPVLGIPISLHPGSRDSAPSLDRTIPALGYVPGNVVVISNRANTLKNNATSAELYAVAAYVEACELSA